MPSQAHRISPFDKAKASGFTLVELAIVMTIIGLLIGGILKGQELVRNARITATIAQVRPYEAALTQFRDSYAALPGDFTAALTRLPGCSLASLCANGNGDSFVGVLTVSYDDVNTALASENAQFWRRLALADFISGISPSADTIQWGISHPTSPIVGGFHARHAGYDPAWCRTNGHACLSGVIIILRARIDGTWGGIDKSLSPADAALIDRKMDDGFAATGYAQSVSDAYVNGCGYPNEGLNGPQGYAETQNRRRCDIMFKLL